MKRKQFKIRYFKCPVCGSIQTAAKTASKMTSYGHAKHMFCWNCHEVQRFIQISCYGDE